MFVLIQTKYGIQNFILPNLYQILVLLEQLADAGKQIKITMARALLLTITLK